LVGTGVALLFWVFFFLRPPAGIKSSPSALDSSPPAAHDTSPHLPLRSPLHPFPFLFPPQEVEARIAKVIDEYKQTLMERTELHMG
jgi:hypothetical protein